MHVAMLSQAYEAAKFLYEFDSTLAYQDNLEHNLPICTLVKKEVLSIKDFDDSICKTEDQVLSRYVEPVFGDTL